MKKHFIALVLVTTLTATLLCGCGSKSSNINNQENTTEQNKETQTVEDKTSGTVDNPTTEETTEAPTETPTEVSRELTEWEKSRAEYERLCQEEVQAVKKDERFKYKVYETWVEIEGMFKPDENNKEWQWDFYEFHKYDIPSEFEGLPVKAVRLEYLGSLDYWVTSWGIDNLYVPESVIKFENVNINITGSKKYEYKDNAGLIYLGDIKKLDLGYTVDSDGTVRIERGKEEVNGSLVDDNRFSQFLARNFPDILMGMKGVKSINISAPVFSAESENIFPEGCEKIVISVLSDYDVHNVIIPESCSSFSLTAKYSKPDEAGYIVIPKSVTELNISNFGGIIKTYKGSAAMQYALDNDIAFEILD